MKKGLLACLLACALFLLGSGSAFAADRFPDVDPNTETGQAIYALNKAGVVGGYEDGTFRPNGKLTRAEFVKIVNHVFLFKDTNQAVKFFDDSKKHWVWREIMIAQKNHYIGGVGPIKGVGKNCFAPNQTLTREQVAAILGRIVSVEDIAIQKTVIKDKVSPWAKKDCMKIAACGLMPLEKNNTFRGTKPMTRAEVCVVLAPFTKRTPPLPLGEEKNVQLALVDAMHSLNKLAYQDPVKGRILHNLRFSIRETLYDNWRGGVLTKENVKAKHGAAIRETLDLYESLSEDERTAFKQDIARDMQINSLVVLHDYFLTE